MQLDILRCIALFRQRLTNTSLSRLKRAGLTCVSGLLQITNQNRGIAKVAHLSGISGRLAMPIPHCVWRRTTLNLKPSRLERAGLPTWLLQWICLPSLREDNACCCWLKASPQSVHGRWLGFVKDLKVDNDSACFHCTTSTTCRLAICVPMLQKNDAWCC